MSAHIAIEPSTSAAAAATPRSPSGKKSRIGETTGECAAVCCCCPCAVVHLLILAVYRLPTGIWRRKRLLSKKNNRSSPKKKMEDRQQSAADGEGSRCGDGMYGGENDAVRWDNEMWRQFYGGGFWRSDSRGNDD